MLPAPAGGRRSTFSKSTPSSVVWVKISCSTIERPSASQRRAGAAREKTAEKYQADTVAQIVVAVQVGLLEVLDDELAVKEQGAEKGGTERAVAQPAASAKK